MCIAKFNQNQGTYELNGESIIEPEFAQIECYELIDYDHFKLYSVKNENRKNNRMLAIKNISYFLDEINNSNIFNKATISCLDLTTAKVIKDKIFTNGDVMTYLKLKKEVAKRNLYDYYGKGQIRGTEILKWSEYEDGDKNKKRPEGVLNITLSNGNGQNTEKTIYWYNKKYEGIPINENYKYTQDNLEKSLNIYLNSLRESVDNNKHIPSIPKINNLRDAITANMVGVICHLQIQKKYHGFILLEDLEKGDIKRHFDQCNENISRRLENALYNKFQILGLVPPHVKNIIQLREDFREIQKEHSNKLEKENKQKSDQQILSSQIGSIVFVDKENTSQKCPSCDEKIQPENKNDLKYRQHRFICEKCGFDTYFFKPQSEQIKDPQPVVNLEHKKQDFEVFKTLDDPDKIAAYNIARKITDSNKIAKWMIQKNIQENQCNTNKKNTTNRRNYKNKFGRPKHHIKFNNSKKRSSHI